MVNLEDGMVGYDIKNRVWVSTCQTWSARPVYELRKWVQRLGLAVDILPLEKFKHDSYHPWLVSWTAKDEIDDEIVIRLLSWLEHKENWGLI